MNGVIMLDGHTAFGVALGIVLFLGLVALLGILSLIAAVASGPRAPYPAESADDVDELQAPGDT